MLCERECPPKTTRYCACAEPEVVALCQMLGFSPYESSLAPIIVMVGAILFAQK